MKISLNWIKDFVPLDPKMKPQELADLLTTKAAEVEGVEDLSKGFENIVVGKIQTIKPHPDADKLQVVDTLVAPGKIVQIVCGGSNIYEGMYAPAALAGAKVKWHGEGDLIELKPTKVRGVLSEGMLCTNEELSMESEGHDVITDLKSFDVKEGMPLSKVFSKNDIVFEVDNKSLTHRPDLWGHYGIAREMAAITGKKLKPLDLKVQFPAKGESPDIQIKDYDLCPRYCGVIIKNIKVEDSSQWMKDRLIAVGYRPISNIVDITNYVMAELGQPLHAFDKNYIKKGIVVRRAEKNEKITTLDGQNRKLDTDTLVIADHEKPVAIAGVMGGENSEINDGTTEIIIESANFNPESIRKTSTRLGLRTEAVQRFEKSLDPVLAETAIKRTCELILQLCPDAEIVGPITDASKGPVKQITVDLDVKKVSSKIGVPISLKQSLDILESLEFGVVKKSENILKVTIPTFRSTKDVDIEDDLVEEIARMYGYDKISPTLPDLPIKVPMRNKERTLKHKARKLLAYGLGVTEVYNYAFYSQEEIKKTLIEDTEKSHVLIENPLSQDQTHMRASLVPNLLKNIAGNLRFFGDFKVFEVGRTYVEEGNYFPKEEKWLVGAVVVPTKDKREVFFEAKSIVSEFLQGFVKRKTDFIGSEKSPAYAHPSRSAHIEVDGELLQGGVFEVHPLALKNWGIEAKVAMFELNFTALCKYEEKTIKYKQIPKFPGLDIDISVVIDRKRKVGDLEKAIYDADKSLISNVKLFDRYEGENIDDDKKALAFRVYLQAADRTLTDEEMAKIQKQIFANLQKLGGTIRGA